MAIQASTPHPPHGRRPEAPPFLSVVLLSHNRPRLLARAVASVIEDLQRLDGIGAHRCECIVVDNRSEASHDVGGLIEGLGERAAGQVPLRLVRLPSNVGFTGGMNAGLAAARGRYVFLTEDDIELTPGCLDTLLRYLDARPEVGLAAPLMFDAGGGTVRCAGGRLGLGSVFRLEILGVGDAVDAHASRAPYLVDFVPGAAMMARTATWRRLGGFRREFFMYQEDVELCLRLAARGLSIAVVPPARVSHLEERGSSRGDSTAEGLLTFHKMKNLAAVYLLHAPRRVIPAFVLRYALRGAVPAWRDGRLRIHLRAWAWAVRHAVGLWRDRTPARTVPRARLDAGAAVRDWPTAA